MAGWSGSPVGSNPASSPLAFTSGRRTSTPWRRASATRVRGDQNPIGWELSSAAVKAAGWWSFSQAEE